MPGLLEPQQEQPQAPAQQGQEASPEQQQQFESYVRNGMKLIHSEESRDSIVDLIAEGESPALGAAMALVSVIKQLDTSLGEQGQQFDKKAKMAATQELLGQILEVSQAVTGDDMTDADVGGMLQIASEEGVGA